jgi:hypothetical protein
MNVAVTTALLATLLGAAACGGNAAPATTPTSSEQGEHHHGMPATTKAFHDVLAPLWHMEKGADRTAKTCAQAMTLREKAVATGDKELAAAAAALVAECEKEGRPEFDARFTAVHERFHALAEK